MGVIKGDTRSLDYGSYAFCRGKLEDFGGFALTSNVLDPRKQREFEWNGGSVGAQMMGSMCGFQYRFCCNFLT